MSNSPKKLPPVLNKNLTQKCCEKCHKYATKISRDKFNMRTCKCGHTWYPTKIKAVPNESK